MRQLTTLLLWTFLLTSAEVVAAPQKPADLCGPYQRSILAYQTLYVDDMGLTRRAAELWLDGLKQTMSGLFYQPKKKTATYLSGTMIDKDHLFLCEYSPRSGAVLGVWTGVISKTAISFERRLEKTAAVETWSLKQAKTLQGARSYTIRSDVRETTHFIPGRHGEEGPETCVLIGNTIAFFGLNQKALELSLNKRIQDIYDSGLEPGQETTRCQTIKHPPRSETLAVGLMYADDHYVSLKIDESQSVEGRSNLSGRVLNIDLMTGREFTLSDFFVAGYNKILFQEVRRRLTAMYGDPGRYAEDTKLDIAFTPTSLVVSLVPVDVKGWYLPTFRIDVPIPLDEIKPLLGPKGPLSGWH